ncbi:hypothetical protein BJ170DRAFT_447852 [Xylariales sp. AK1849]|nr:hypothetical protein BJ170DRAFT_447852 [Xylariales sp. AK1849]
MANENYRWMLDALDGVLPEQTLHFLQDHVLAPQTPFQTVLRALQSYAQRLLSTLWPLLQPIVLRVGDLLSDSPDFIFIAVLVGIIALGFQVLLWVHRFMMFWTRLVTRALMWAAVAAVIAVVWQRGPEAAIRDVVVFVSKAVGYATIVKNIWLTEYHKYDAQTKNSRKVGGGGRARRGGR